ncbi:MAG: hypothetical protein AB4050_17540 [Synechococcus sp.]
MKNITTTHHNSNNDLDNTEEFLSDNQAELTPELRNNIGFPYKGLNPYTEADKDIFFGRERDIQRILNNLFAWRIVVLYGESGVGKSSVLRAGVVSAIHDEAENNKEDFGVPKLAVTVFPPLDGKRSWKEDPLDALGEQIEEDLRNTGLSIITYKYEKALFDKLKDWAHQLGGEKFDGRILIILDQFEEYLLYHSPDSSNDSFIREISRIIDCPEMRVNFLISLREDSYSKLERLRKQIPSLLDVCLHIEHLDIQSAKEAINNPIDRYNQDVPSAEAVKIDEDLVDTILKEIPQVEVEKEGRGLAGTTKIDRNLHENQILPPYLQLVMSHLWSEMKLNHLTLETLIQLANQKDTEREKTAKDAIKWIIREHVSKTMNSIESEREKSILARSFQYLVTPSGTKYSYTVQDLATFVGCDSNTLKKLLDKLSEGNRRIIRSVGQALEREDECRYEVFHDFLCQAVLDWRRDFYFEQKQRENKQKQRENEQRERRLLIRRTLAGVVIGCLALFYPIGRWHINHNKNNIQNRIENTAHLIDSGKLLDALQSSISNAQNARNFLQKDPLGTRFISRFERDDLLLKIKDQIQNILSKIQESNYFSFAGNDGIRLFELSIDMKTAAAVFVDGHLQVKDLTTGRNICEAIHEGFDTGSNPIQGLRFSPEGQILFVAFNNDQIRRWNIQDRQRCSELSPIERSNSDENLELEPNVNPLVVRVFEANPNSIKIFDWETGYLLFPILPFERENLLTSALSPNSQMLATSTISYAGEHFVRLWERAKDISNSSTVFPADDSVVAMDFSEDSKILATATVDGSIQLWDLDSEDNKNEVASYQLNPELQDASTSVLSLSFIDNGNSLAVGLNNGQVQLLNLLGERIFFQNHLQAYGPVRDISFSSEQLLILDNEFLSFWNLLQDSFQLPMPLQGEMSFSSRLDSSGEFLALTSWNDNRVQIWNVLEQKQIGLVDALDIVLAVSFNPNTDDIDLATISLNNVVQLWDLEGNQVDKFFIELQGNQVDELSPVEEEAKVPNPQELQFNRDGNIIAISFDNGTVQLWGRENEWTELSTEETSRIVRPFRAAGDTFAILSDNGSIQRWNVSAREWDELTTNEKSGIPHEFLFSPDGQTFATISNDIDSIIRIWNLSGEEISNFNLPGRIENSGFSPDGNSLAFITLASDTNDYIVTLWNLNGKELVRLTLDERVEGFRFSPDSKLLAIHLYDGSIQLWNFNEERIDQFPLPNRVRDLRFTSQDSQNMLTAVTVDGIVNSFKLLNDEPVEQLSLDTLINSGCDWLQPYLESHPENSRVNICPL